MMDVHNVVMSLSRRRRFPSTWLGPDSTDPEFPAFVSPLAGGTAWYTMRLTALTEDREQSFDSTLAEAVAEYESREPIVFLAGTQSSALPWPPTCPQVVEADRQTSSSRGPVIESLTRGATARY